MLPQATGEGHTGAALPGLLVGTEGPCPIAQKQTLGKQLRWGKSLEPSQEELVPKPPLIPGAQGHRAWPGHGLGDSL